MQTRDDLHFYMVPVVAVSVFAFFIAHCFLSVYEVREHWIFKWRKRGTKIQLLIHIRKYTLRGSIYSISFLKISFLNFVCAANSAFPRDLFANMTISSFCYFADCLGRVVSLLLWRPENQRWLAWAGILHDNRLARELFFGFDKGVFFSNCMTLVVFITKRFPVVMKTINIFSMQSF